jgi:hypothetical protein
VVPLYVVELIAQLVTSEGSQILASIDEQLCVGHIVVLGEAMQERCRGIRPEPGVSIDYEQDFESVSIVP